MYKICLLGLLVVICGLVYAGPVKAEELRSSTSDKITVLPAKFELWAKKGESLTQSLKIINDDDHDYIYAMSIDPISTTGENGEVQIGSSNPNLPNLLSSWVNTDQTSGILEAKKTKIINFKISIPQDAEIGGKYASIVISMDRVLRDVGEPSAVAKVVSLLMISVAGDFDDNAQVLSFSANKRIDGSYSFPLRVRNQGINHIKPQGTIVISNFLGRQIAEVDLDAENILPGSNRQIVSRWNPDKSLFGVYTATLVANYGQSNRKTLSAIARFSEFPFWQSLMLLVVLTALVFAVIWATKMILPKINKKNS